MNIMERIKRYQLAEKCAAMTPEIIDFGRALSGTKSSPSPFGCKPPIALWIVRSDGLR
jgi:hypothetical protein